ncbi:MAG: LysE family transporter [Paludibacteraceae bacterium]
MISMLLKGLVIGVFVSAPVGPIGILCLQRTLNRGRAHGIATALGATLSDLLYAVIAVFSMSFIIEFITSHQFILQIIGSIIVFFFGLYTYISNPIRKLSKMNNDKKNYIQDFFTSFGLTITNPLVIFLFIALFAKFSYITDDTTFLQSICGIFFIMCGALFWWTLLVNIVNMFRSRFNMRGLYVINRGTGIILMILAIGSLAYSLFF